MSGTPRGVAAGANLTIIKKGLVLVAIPLLAQLLFLAVLFKMRRDQEQAQGLALHSKDVIATTEGALRMVMESRSDVRGLTLTGDVDFVSSWQQTRGDALLQLRALRELVADNPPQQQRIDGIIQQTEEMFARLETIAQMAQRTETRGKAVAALKEPLALQFLEDLRRKIDDFLKEEESLNAERQTRLASAGREQAWTLVGGALLALLSTAVLAYLFSRSIASRLAVLIDNTRRLAAGEPLAPPLTGRDELGRLDRVFHEMADTLVQKDRENEMFVYSVSHDLRSPLVNLQGFSQELALVCEELRRLAADNKVPAAVRERLTTLIDRDAGESIGFIQTAVRRLAAIIDALLRLSRVGRVVYDWQPVDVRAAVERVVHALTNTITQKGARVVVGELPLAWGDPTAIEQIFANLLGNALNYLDPSRPGTIEVGSRQAEGAGEGHIYYVKDNGLGIDPDHQPKIFLAFQRLHPTAAPGEGIGLALVRRMMERHGGRIWVESAVGKGSTFFLTLPASDRRDTGVNGKATADRQTSGAKISEQGELTTWPQSRST
jgi:signal transduction histidine kinase